MGAKAYQKQEVLSVKEECLICKAPLEYLETDILMECEICHKTENSKTRCVNGHYVCNDCHTQGLDTILGLCMEETSKDPIEIIERAKDQADLIWLENLNLRGQFKGDIMRYIAEKYPQLIPLYDEIYNKGKRDYWQALEAQVKQICSENDFPYLRNDLPYGRSKPGKPVIVNYFYHEEIRLNNR